MGGLFPVCGFFLHFLRRGAFTLGALCENGRRVIFPSCPECFDLSCEKREVRRSEGFSAAVAL